MLRSTLPAGDTVRCLHLSDFDLRWDRYRLLQPKAEVMMAKSLAKYGQIAPVVYCQLEGSLVLIDGFKRLRAVGGGEETGPSPVDRRKKGTKFTLMVDRQGVPLVIRCAPANRSDHQEILPTVVAYPEVGGRPGRPKTHPDKLFADAGYDCEPTRTVLRFLGIEPHIRKSRGKHGSHLGRIRWVVERTISWLKGLRRLRVRYDRLKELIHGWINLAAAVICFRLMQDNSS